MKKPAFIIFLVFVSMTTIGFASEVAEVAKKEKARRQAVEKDGKKAKTFTNQDIANLKTTLAFEASQTEATEPKEIVTLPAADREPSATQTTTPEQDQQDQERKEQEQKLNEEREKLEQEAKDAQQLINQGGGYYTRNIGNQYKMKREAEARIREIDEKLKNNEEEEEQ